MPRTTGQYRVVPDRATPCRILSGGDNGAQPVRAVREGGLADTGRRATVPADMVRHQPAVNNTAPPRHPLTPIGIMRYCAAQYEPGRTETDSTKPSGWVPAHRMPASIQNVIGQSPSAISLAMTDRPLRELWQSARPMDEVVYIRQRRRMNGFADVTDAP
jgi:hypothetical protein